ncbi:Glutaredoxin, GrxC [mine drainage metagenome]|uniref:Glutaredoxin, GrxC n=1 Tax=mine drainage metagenome TaxID=410659 RepID=T1BRI7_9ZZZZ
MTAAIIVYTTPHCAYCRIAKELLTSRGWVFREVDVADDPAARTKLVETTGRKTVPQIFIDHRPIGGFEELKALDDSGALARLVSQTRDPQPDSGSTRHE